MVCENFHILKYQILTVVFVNIGTFSIGSNVAWLATALPLFLSENSPLKDGPVSHEMAGWIGSSISIGALCGCVILSFISNYIGNQKTILLCGIPLIISCLFIIFGTAAFHICLSRICCGIAWGGGLATILQFLAEILSDFIRGEMTSYLGTSCYLGVLFSIVCGTYLPYETFSLILIIFPLLFLCSFFFVHDSPQYLLRTGKIDLAEKSLRFYRNCLKGNNGNEETFQKEFEKFMAISKQRETTEKLIFSEFANPKLLRALIISPVLSAVGVFSGYCAMTNYTVIMFEQTGSTIDPYVSAIVMGVVQVVGTYIASQLIDRIGRKTLLLISTSGGFVAILVTGIFAYLDKQGFDMSSFNLLPVICISLQVFIEGIGLESVPLVLFSEVLPRRFRSFGAAIFTGTHFIFQFIMLMLFPTMLLTLGLDVCMLMFAAVIAFGFFFTIFMVQETKGINLDVLEVKGNNKDTA